MIVIADSGSTKTDWVVLNDEKKELFRTNSIGMNPYFVSSDIVTAELNKNATLCEVKDRVKAIYFYGAGCSTLTNKEVIRLGLSNFFTYAHTIVCNHDLLAACYAAYQGKPAMVCILGTGSNSCYFDGKNLHEETKSLAYILGDEGSGNHIGKKILRAYFNKKMPEHLAKAFEEKYHHLTVEELNKKVYQNQFANAYLASFSEFAGEHQQDPYIQRLIYDSMRAFLEVQILPYAQARSSELNFIGSIAHFYENIIRAAAAEFHLSVGHIIRKPIDNLVNYHIKYLLNDDATA
ncbi:BadF/BadG/BcrA/BcrD ATPase family protein [Vaginella massiliensis]|uniref:BadF/BadG/BcrA/BcrD ATPase family protein n=1 Tax=Vaginella massiliensis TaxID=1816680 RepID=UPI003750D297